MTIYEGRESPFFFNVITVYPDNVKPPNHINDWKCGINISMRTNPTQMGENTREHEFNTKHWSKKKTIAYEKKKNKISLNMFVYPALRECQRQQFCEGGDRRSNGTKTVANLGDLTEQTLSPRWCCPHLESWDLNLPCMATRGPPRAPRPGGPIQDFPGQSARCPPAKCTIKIVHLAGGKKLGRVSILNSFTFPDCCGRG